MTIRTIIVDDEKMARTLLSGMLQEINKDIKVVDMCEDVASAVKSIRKHKPDLIFLDIEMPGHSGLELLDFFNKDEITFSIIFITAYNQYAIQAFKLSAIDYLLKPVSASDLEQAIERYQLNMHEEKAYSILRENLLLYPLRKIAVSMQQAVKFIELDSIMYFKASGAYTELCLEDKQVVISSKGLKHYEDMLDEQHNFMRCHKSFVVNLNFVSEYVRADGGYLLMKNGHQVSISSEKTDEFMRKMSLI